MDYYGSTCEELRAWAKQRRLPAFRGQQLFDALYGERPVDRFADVPVWPAPLRTELDAAETLQPGVEVRCQRSGDGTVKSLLRLQDGSLVECVGIPTEDRQTVCISSQVGCAVGCSFCASGLEGVKRDLSAGEMVYQVLHHHRRRPVTNVVFMGSGEPLFNYQAVLQAIRVMGEPRGLGLGRRRITVSTSGVAPKIRQFGLDEPQVTLALSLHAPDDATRNRLVPLNKRWNIAELLEAMDVYSQAVNRRMSFEYVLLADSNMAPEQATELAALALRYGAHINLIPYNPVIQTPHQAPSDEQLTAFVQALEDAGGHFTIRGQRGADIDAACGQLARKGT